MSRKTETIYTEYFITLEQYKKSHGPDVFLLFEVGSFYEVYSVQSADKQTMIMNPEIAEFSRIISCKVVAKSNCFYNTDKTESICMCGFRNYDLDKHLEKLCQSAGSRVVIFNQEDVEGQVEKRRVLAGIYSPSTFVSATEDREQLSNHIMCIWAKRIIMKRTPWLICGMAVINVLTGSSAMFEYEVTADSTSITQYDELERWISVYAPSEVILIADESDYTRISALFQGAEPRTFGNQRVFIQPADSTKIANISQQVYTDKILVDTFGVDSVQHADQFTQYPLATQTVCYLLDYLTMHNPQLVDKVAMPSFDNHGHRVTLANYTMKQLNILDDGQSSGKLASVLSLFNNCQTAIGKRRYKHLLTHPTSDPEWLATEYDMVEGVLGCPWLPEIRLKLSSVYDIEKYNRMIIMKKITPDSLARCCTSLEVLSDIVNYVNTEDLTAYLGDVANLTDMIQFIRQHLNIQLCMGQHKIEYKQINEDEPDIVERCILNPEMFPELNTVFIEYREAMKTKEAVINIINELCSNQQSSKKKVAPTLYVKLHEMEKTPPTFQITKSRSQLLKEALKGRQQIRVNDTLTIPCSEIQFSAATGTNNEITCPGLTTLCNTIWSLQNQLDTVISEQYKCFLDLFEARWTHELQKCCTYVGKLDVLLCRAYNAATYNLCKPTICCNEGSDQGSVNAVKLRHPLIERILTSEVYVPNDVSLNGSGMLLFGINSSGKTSLMRSLGIAIILAQTGQYVPSNSFTFTPYRAIYTRIIGNDNLFKGLSSFSVEMSELKVILEKADRQSLVLADEISKGSEMQSAMCITAATLMALSKRGVSYMVTSHLHEIMGFSEVTGLSGLAIKHLSVRYDGERDLLIYDRHLKDGSGENFYGIAVCRSLHFPGEFIETAYNLRTRYLALERSTLDSDKSPYNAKKIIGMCELCGAKVGEEVHHLSPQKGANEQGFFATNGAHKNHVANLAAVCQQCHDKIHSMGVQLVRKKTDKGSRLVIDTSVSHSNIEYNEK